MNRRMRALKSEIESKVAEAKTFTEGETKDIAKAESLMDEVDSLTKEFNLEKRLFEAETAAGAEEAKPQEANVEHMDKEVKDNTPMLVKAVRSVMNPTRFPADKALSSTVGEDGGYTIPEDNLTAVNQFKEAEGAVLPYITVESVTTPKGTRVYQKRGGTTGFAKMKDTGMDSKSNSEGGNQVDNPKFEKIEYSIEKYAGFMPVPRDLVDDSDANIMSIVTDWMHKNQRKTDNAEVFGLLGADTMTGWTALADLDAIKNAVNVDLEDFAGSVAIYTNSDGVAWLDTLKDKNDRPLLNPVPNEPAKLQLTAGFTTIPVVKFPNSTLASAADKIPFILGDMKEAVIKFDRKQMTLAASDVATVGDLNAFAQDMTIVRAISRADYVIRDASALVKGYIAKTAG